MMPSARSLKITPTHLERKAVVYIRQSTPKQVRMNTESQYNQRALEFVGESYRFRQRMQLEEQAASEQAR